jgi:predicted small lipoprotein YifL
MVHGRTAASTALILKEIPSMKLILKSSTFLVILTILFLTACGEEKYTGPESVGPEEVNTVMNEAFADASDDVKKVVKDMLVSYGKGEFTKASAIVQALLSRTDITDSQRQMASRCLMTVNDEMQRAIAEKGDRKAEQYLRHLNANK